MKGVLSLGLQIPVALLGTDINGTSITHQPPVPPPSADKAAVIAAAEAINQSHRPVILAGGGCRHAATAVQQLAEAIDAPVLMTINARGVLPPEHPLSVPVSGTMNAARKAVADSDVVIALGTELAATDYDQYKDDGFNITGKLIRCDVDPMQLHNNFQADVGVVADAGRFANSLKQQITAQPRNGAQRSKLIVRSAQSELTGEMQRHLSILERIRHDYPEAIFAGDSTQMIYSTNLVFNTAQPGHWFNSSVGFGTLGYALPAAIGAGIAKPSNPIICIIGDGGLQFVLGELGALKDTGVPVAILVWRNQGYREIKTSMEQAGVTSVGVEFTVPDYLQVAAAYGLPAVHVEDDNALHSALASAFTRNEPVLIEIDEAGFMQLQAYQLSRANTCRICR
ncbi:MAG: thiamine pyrophosphate-dependent enzyme [Pseudomonadota bacterium]